MADGLRAPIGDRCQIEDTCRPHERCTPLSGAQPYCVGSGSHLARSRTTVQDVPPKGRGVRGRCRLRPWPVFSGCGMQECAWLVGVANGKLGATSSRSVMLLQDLKRGAARLPALIFMLCSHQNPC